MKHINLVAGTTIKVILQQKINQHLVTNRYQAFSKINKHGKMNLVSNESFAKKSTFWALHSKVSSLWRMV